MQQDPINKAAGENPPILLFDGVCNLCNHSVQWVINRDPQGIFRFASLQSDLGQHLLSEAGMSTDEFNTVILYDKGAFFTHSDVPLIILKKLGGLWSLFYVFHIIPKSLRDLVYNWVARNRYHWFGRRESCMIPTPELKKRFLDW